MADPFIVPRADYSWLANLPEQFAQGEQLGRESALRGALAKIPLGPNGEQDFGAMMKAFSQYGSPSDIANMAMTISQQKMTQAYRGAELSGQQRTRDIDSAKAVISSYPLSRRDYFAANPDQAPADYQQAIATLRGGDQGAPAVGSVPAPSGTTPAAATPQKGMSYEKWKLITSGKMAPPEQAKAQIDTVDDMLDNTREQLQKALDNPHLTEVFGGVTSMLTGKPATQSPLGMLPGSYNVLPEWATAGTTAATAHAQLEAIKNQLSSVVINSMKEASGKIGGSTGLGRVLQSEFAAWSNFFGSLNQIQDVDSARETLRNAIKFIDQSKARHKRTYEADYGDIAGETAPQEPTVGPGFTTTVPTGLPPTAPPSAGDVPVQGAAVETRDPRGAYLSGQGRTTATGPNGHKIVLVNGQWVDAKTGQPVQ